MNRFRLRISLVMIVLFATSLCTFAQSSPSTLSVGEILRRRGPSVMMIEVLDKAGQVTGFGSGVIIRRDGVLATNYHVIDWACDVRVRITSSAEPVQVVSLINHDSKGDIVLLRLAREGLPVASLFPVRRVTAGDKVIAIGNPMGLERSVSEGIVSGIRRMDSGDWIQITAPISPGSSGGGLFNDQGQLVGITTFFLRESQNLNFAVPIERAVKLLANPVEVPWSRAKVIFCKGQSSEQVAPPPLVFPREWIFSTDATTVVMVRIEGNYLYEQFSVASPPTSPLSGSLSGWVVDNVMCETRPVGPEWHGLCTHQIAVYDFLGDLVKRCVVRVSERLTAVTPHRIERVSQRFSLNVPDASGCPSPINQWSQSAIIPR